MLYLNIITGEVGLVWFIVSSVLIASSLLKKEREDQAILMVWVLSVLLLVSSCSGLVKYSQMFGEAIR